MIPVPAILDTGGFRLGDRAAVGTGQWVMLTRKPAREGASAIDGDSPTAAALTAAVPADAWRGTAAELAAIIAPVGGEHCPRCRDTMEEKCACCAGEGHIECACDGCPAVHMCSTCDGDGGCACDCEVRARSRIARIRGEAWGGRMLAVLRGLLAAIPADTLAAAWTTPAGTARRKGKSVPLYALAVDLGGGDLRWMAASMAAAADDELTEVTL